MAVIDLLKEFTTARIEVPLPGGEVAVLECVLRATSAPFIEAVFLPGQLPTLLNKEGAFRLTFEALGRPHALNARLDAIVDGDRLRLFAGETLSAEQQREFFRIDVELSLSYGPWPEEGEELQLRPFRGVVNLSGGGMWLPVFDPLEPRQFLALQLTLPTKPPFNLSCKAQVIRLTWKGTERTGVALKFLHIEEAHREDIVAFCFAEQRRQMRTKVRV